MGKQHERVEFEKLEDDIVKLRYFDRAKTKSCYSWKIPLNEANDLAKWWEKEGVHIRKRQFPIIKHKFGSILITMHTHSSVDVRGFDQYGGLKTLGHSLPRKVVECLSVWLQDGQQSQKSNNKKKGRRCSTKCS